MPVQMTSVNYMDRCMMKLYRERAERLVKRRQEDVKDQSLEYMPGTLTAVFSGLLAVDVCYGQTDM